MLSQLALASVSPSGLNATPVTASVCPVRVALGRPVTASHSHPVLLSSPLANIVPSGLNATLVTTPVCPVRVVLCCPVSASHSCTVRSFPVASVSPSGLNATPSTWVVCAVRVTLCCPVRTSHNRTVSSSQLTAASVLPSGLNATLEALEDPVMRSNTASVSASYIQIPIVLATAKRLPSGEYAIVPAVRPLPRRTFAPSGKLHLVWSWA